MKVLLSIKPQFAKKIFDGTKRFEFRKSLFTDARVCTVVVYVTRPIGQIVGEFDIKEVLAESPEVLWAKTKDHSGITKDFFDSYFEGRARSFAISIGNVRRYPIPVEPNDLIKGFTAPQSYMYIRHAEHRSQRQTELALT